MNQVKQLLQQVFGNIPFRQEADITAIRRFESNSSYCLDEEGRIIGLAACEYDFEEVRLTAAFQQLQYLNLSDNTKLQGLIFEVALPHLWHFDVSDSALVSLIFPVGFTALKNLDASRNQLQTFISEGTLNSLTYLDLSGNQLETLSLDAPNAKSLYLLNNQLHNLQLAPSQSLATLNLKNNLLEELPTSLVKFTGLDVLYLHGNPLTNLPSSLIPGEEGYNSVVDIQSYLQSLVEDDTQANDEVKLILLGNSTAGKSTLINYILEGIFNETQASTHGISNRTTWQPAGQDFSVRLWDFGGQDYYHATHRLFFSRNAVSIVLFEQKTNTQGQLDTPIYIYDNNESKKMILPLAHFHYSYWLNSLQHYTGYEKLNSTMLVQSKMDIEPKEKIFIPDTISKQYELDKDCLHHLSIKGAYDKNKRHTRDFESFQDDLVDLLNRTKSQYELSTKWVAIRTAVRDLSSTRVVISKNELDALCRAEKPNITTEEIKTLSAYLHDIGTILFYPDNPTLSETVFINPSWVTDTIYKVLDYSVIKKHGRFDLEHVKEVVKDFDAVQFLSLMKQFELIFEEQKQTDHFVAPQYLPREIPEKAERMLAKYRKKCNHFAFMLHYPNFLPESVMTRIICNYGDLSLDAFWKNGIGFDLEDEKGDEIRCLIERTSAQHIKVFCSKTEASTVINQIFDQFREINQRNKLVEISVNGEDFVRVEELMNHPSENPIIESVAAKWIQVASLHPIYLKGKFRAGKDRIEIPVENKKEEALILRSGVSSILFLASNPGDTGRLRLDKELREIEESLVRSKKRDTFELKQKGAVRTSDLRRVLLDETPNFLHFSGHGLSKKSDTTGSKRGLLLNKDKDLYGGIILENNSGQSQYVSGQALANLIQLFCETIDCVLLNSCYSEKQANAIIEHVPYVVGMTHTINDSAAIVFATAFYDAIGAGKTIDLAFDFAKNAMELDGFIGDAQKPQLLKNEAIIRKRNSGSNG